MKIFIAVLVIISVDAHAFNWTRCHSSNPVSGQGGGVFEFLSTVVSNSAVGTTQFVSSWGDCSLIGEASKVRRTFIAHNLPYLKQDISKGSGEYIDAYARLHDCNQQGTSLYGKLLKKKYFEIGSDFEKAYLKLEEPFQNLKEFCPLT